MVKVQMASRQCREDCAEKGRVDESTLARRVRFGCGADDCLWRTEKVLVKGRVRGWKLAGQVVETSTEVDICRVLRKKQSLACK